MDTSINSTFYRNAGLGRLNDALLFLQKYFRLFVVLGSFLLSFLFVFVKGELLSTMNIDLTSHLGQVQTEGTYEGLLYYGDYTLQTNNLIRNRSFVDGEKVLNRYTPVYPILLFGAYQVSEWFGLEVRTGILLLTALLTALSALLICEIAFLLYQNRLLALLSGLVFASQPYILQGLTKTMSVTPFMTFFFLGVFLFFGLLLRRGNNPVLPLLLVGIVLGIATLTRPIGLFLPFVFAFLFIVLYRGGTFLQRAIYSSAILVGALAAIAPWQAFNYGHGEKILLSSDKVHSIVDGVMFNNSPSKEPMRLPEDVNALALRLSTSGVESKGEFFGLVFQEFKQDPVPVIKLYFIKAARSWYGAFAQQPSKEVAKLGISLFYLLLTVIGIFRLDLSDYKSRVYVLTFVLLTLYFWAMTILVVSMVRYMIPVFGLMSVFIPAILWGKKPLLKKKNASPVAVNSGN